MIRVNFSFGHLDRPDSFTRWSFDVPSARDRDATPRKAAGFEAEGSQPGPSGIANTSPEQS